jgi:hypothetical protein
MSAWDWPRIYIPEGSEEMSLETMAESPLGGNLAQKEPWNNSKDDIVMTAPSQCHTWPLLANRFRVGYRLGNGSSAEVRERSVSVALTLFYPFVPFDAAMLTTDSLAVQVRLGWDLQENKRVALKYIEDDALWERKREIALINHATIRNHPKLVGPKAVVRNFGTKTCQTMTGDDADQRKVWKRPIQTVDTEIRSDETSCDSSSQDEESDEENTRDGGCYDVCVIVMDLQGKNLRHHLNTSGILSFGSFVRAFRDLLESVSFLHAHGLIHRDIKPENLFWDNVHRILKLGDFGLTRQTLSSSDDNLTPQMVTRWYRSPELLHGETR